MRNFIKDGRIVDLAAPYAVVSGAGALVSKIFGVALNGLASGATGPFAVTGAFDLPKASGDTPGQGALIYWDDSAKKVTTTDVGNTLIGFAESAVLSGGATVRVVLNGLPGAPVPPPPPPPPPP